MPRFLLFLCLALSVLPAAVSAQRVPAFRTEEGGPRLRVTARVRTGSLPKSVNVSPDGSRVVVCNFGRLGSDNVFVYDSQTLEHVGTVSFEGNAVESAFSSDGETLYVSNFRGHRVEVIDFERLLVTSEIEVGAHPKTIVLSEDDSMMYVANYFDGTVSVVDLAAGREVRRLRTGERPRGMGILHDGTLLTAAFHEDFIRSFEGGGRSGAASDSGRSPAMLLRTGETAHDREWSTCRFPRDIRPSPDRRSYYLTCTLGHVGFYRPEDGRRPFGIASTGRNPRSLGLSRDGRWLAVANFGSDDVSLIDTVRRTHRQQRVPGASRIVGVAVHPGPGIRLYVTSWDTGELIMLTGEVPTDTVAPGQP